MGPPSAGARDSPGRYAWFHPICFAVFPILSLFAANIQSAYFSNAVRPLLVTLAGTVVVAAPIVLLMRNFARAAIFLTLLVFLFFSYGHLVDGAVNHGWATKANGLNSVHGVLLGVDFALLVAGWALIQRIPEARLRAMHWLLNVVGSLLVLMPAMAIVVVAQRTHRLSGILHHTSTDPPVTAHGIPGSKSDQSANGLSGSTADLHPPTVANPDIYYIILDAYGREDVLHNYYGFDNRPFLDALRQHGFYVASQSRPNYGQTIESISCSLNMKYLDQVAGDQGQRSNDFAPLTEMIDHNAVAAALGPRGYRFVAINTGYPLTVPKNADTLFLPDNAPGALKLTAFEIRVLNLTPFSMLKEKEYTLYDQHRNAILNGFRELADLPRLPYRKFAFVHILAPHPPFVLGPNDEPVEADRPFSLADGSDYIKGGERSTYQRKYIAQLQGINKLVLSAINMIYARSKVRPIIILQGDHGPRSLVDWTSLERTDVRETYGNLSAFALPDGEAPSVFPDDITPVNIFRALLDYQFGANLPHLPDRCYFSTSAQPYAFTEITDRVPRKLSSTPP